MDLRPQRCKVLVMPHNWFGDDVAARYDDSQRAMFAPEAIGPAVGVLAELAAGGDVLELGIGTGRLALPLRDSVTAVHGIDLSTAMLERLAAKPGAEDIGTTVGDFADTMVPGRFRLVYLVFNTIMNVTAQDRQVACFRNAARHLEPGGAFLVEVMVPQLQQLPAGECFRPLAVTEGGVSIDEYDVVNQGLVSHHYRAESGQLRSIPFRYVWPGELDLMAALAGLSLESRWGGWDKQPFTALSSQHVSVWRKPG